MEKIICKKNLTFKPSRPGGGTFHLDIRLSEINGEIRDWDTLEKINEPILRLSICGRTRGYRGQCSDEIKSKVSNFSDANQRLINKILNIWNEYHLNDCNAGTKYQTDALRNFSYDTKNNLSHYEQCLMFLEKENLTFDRGYKYGSGWLYKEMPQEVIDFIVGL